MRYRGLIKSARRRTLSVAHHPATARMKGALMDLAALSDDGFTVHERTVRMERERRDNLARIPDTITDLSRAYIESGGDTADLVMTDGRFRISGSGAVPQMNGLFIWKTSDPWPNTLPGS